MAAGTVPRRLVLVGSVVVDVNLRVPALPDRGGDVLASALSITAGGGFFVVAAAVAGGLPTTYAGRHGAGPMGDVVRAALHRVGADLALPADTGGDTGPCVVLVEPDGERTMITANGVEASLEPSLLQTLEVRPDDAVYVSGYDLAYPVTGPALAAWLPARDPRTLVVVDPGPLVGDVPAAVLGPVLARTDLLTLDLGEARQVFGSDDPAVVATRAGERLAPGAVVVLRDGPRGATLLVPGDHPLVVPADVVATPDTTGAGDTHAGALVAARAAGLAWPDALRRAAAVTADLLRRRGAAVGLTS